MKYRNHEISELFRNFMLSIFPSSDISWITGPISSNFYDRVYEWSNL